MPKRPDIASALRAAADGDRLVELTRHPKRATPIEGFVAAVGIRWVVLAQLAEGVSLDGFSAVRIRDVTEVGLAGDHDWRSAWLAAAQDGPLELGAVDPSTTTSLLRSVSEVWGVLSTRDERSRVPHDVLGVVHGIHGKKVRLRPLDPVRARSVGSAITIPFDTITRVDFGGRRARALTWALGPRRTMTAVARAGFHTVTPRIVVSDVDGQVAFLHAVFDATGEVVPGRPAEIRIGDSLVMVTSATERDRYEAFLYVYVDDADRTFERAVAAGAAVVEPPLDTPYGDRRAMVRDPFGNVLQIAHPLVRADAPRG